MEPYLAVVFSNYQFFVTPSYDPLQRAVVGIQKLQRVVESSRDYTKAPEGRSDKATFRGLSNDQDDQRLTDYDQLLFLNMFKNSS